MLNSKELLEYTKNLSLLFVEDHIELQENTGEILRNFFKKVDCADNGEDAYELYLGANECKYDIILTDLRMPKTDGIELTKKLYDINPEQAVIIVSAHDDSEYLLPLINLGVEQFIKKPLDYQELLTALLRVSKKIQHQNKQLDKTKQTKVLLSEEFEYDREKRALFQNNQTIYLTKYEIILLQLLTQKVGKIYPNEEIVAYYASVDENIDSQNIRKLVSKLRKKLPADSLESIYGVGYRVIAYS
ncbi:response regulator transcription factor [Sulfurimonas sp.]